MDGQGDLRRPMRRQPVIDGDAGNPQGAVRVGDDGPAVTIAPWYAPVDEDVLHATMPRCADRLQPVAGAPRSHDGLLSSAAAVLWDC